MTTGAGKAAVFSGTGFDLGSIVAEISISSSLSNDRRYSSLAATLERLDPLLSQMSLGFLLNGFNDVDAFSFKICCGDRQISGRFTDVSVLANFLFQELERAMGSLRSLVRSRELLLLWRSCLKIITLLGFDNCLVLEKCSILLSVMSTLQCSERASVLFGNKDVVYRKEPTLGEYVFSSGGMMLSRFAVCTEVAPVVGANLLCPLLEARFLSSLAFLDEILSNRDFKKHLMAAESVNTVTDKLLEEQFAYSDARNLLELVSAHFLFTFCDKSSFGKFTDRLFWSCGMFAESEISLTSSMLLLGTVLNFAPPDLFQAHVISWVSDSIGIHLIFPRKRMDIDSLVHAWFTAFEIAIILYIKSLSLLEVKRLNLKAEAIFDFSEMPLPTFEFSSFWSFQSSVQPDTFKEIHSRSLDFEESCGPILYEDFLRSDLMSASVFYLEDIKHMCDHSCRKEMYDILKSMIFKCLSESVKSKNYSYGIGEERTCERASCLGAILKLMGCSMLQIVRYIRGSDNSGSLKTLKDYAICKEYDFIIVVISSFKHGNPETKSVISNATGSYQQERKTESMIIHFLKLLLLCYNRGPEFLWKGCIFMLMVLLNLLVFEEGNLDAMKSIVEPASEHDIFRPCNAEIHERAVLCESRLKVASDITREVQTERKPSSLCYSRRRKFKDTRSRRPRVSAVARMKIYKDGRPHRQLSMALASKIKHTKMAAEAAGITCNGEAFLKSILHLDKTRRKPDDYDDLADFIVCQEGKDYSTWLKSREALRKWRHDKEAPERKQRGRNFFSSFSSDYE